MDLGDGKIVILDDGTPGVYLDKILKKYPNATLMKSEFYTEKVRFTNEGKRPEKYVIPINLWVEAAQNASENFVLIEDDTWFTTAINLDGVGAEMLENNVAMTKLYWIGNDSINQNKKETPLKDIVLLQPKLFTKIPALYDFIFYRFDKLKIRKTLRFLKINTDERQLAYRTIYAVAGMIFNKNYFTKLWNNHKNSVDEGLQIYNAVTVLHTGKDLQFARYHHEVLKTGFLSAATNQHKEGYSVDVDMFVLNKILNEAWLNDDLDVITSLPGDISIKEITKILDRDTRISSKDWLRWVDNFKDFYKRMGCKID